MSKCEKIVKDHVIQLASTTSREIVVPNTQFTVKIRIVATKLKKGLYEVSLYLPTINFQIINDNNPPRIGGYIDTTGGYLPEKYRPTASVASSTLGANYDGFLQSFSFLDPSFPAPLPGYIVQIDDSGALSIQAAGQFANQIPFGNHCLLPTTLVYLADRTDVLCRNTKLSLGPVDTTQFTGAGAADNGVRDSHLNDAFDDVVAWTWQDNHNIPNKTNGVTNVFVAVGQLIDGRIHNVVVTQLSNFTDASRGRIFDSGVAINRTDKRNLVVSWGNVVPSLGEFLPYSTYSLDGGATWSTPGPLAGVTPPDNGFGDCLGVKADKYGNFWYNYTSFTVAGVDTTAPTFVVSTDKGATWSSIYIAPTLNDLDFYDFPQFAFGNDPSGAYGIYFNAGYFIIDPVSFSFVGFAPFVGFIPIPATGPVPLASTDTGVVLYSLLNQQLIVDVAASNDGRMWTYGATSVALRNSIVSGLNVIYKSPGAITDNYAGPWTNSQAVISLSTNPIFTGLYTSQPVRGFINTCPTSIIYDNVRQALYALSAKKSPVNSQNMDLNLVISRDNGQTWCDPLKIANTNFANRGFQSMALDPVSGNLVFGWYDGREDPTLKTLQYYAAVLLSDRLDNLVEDIPLSNPILLTGDNSIPRLTQPVTATVFSSVPQRKRHTA